MGVAESAIWPLKTSMPHTLYMPAQVSWPAMYPFVVAVGQRSNRMSDTPFFNSSPNWFLFMTWGLCVWIIGRMHEPAFAISVRLALVVVSFYPLFTYWVIYLNCSVASQTFPSPAQQRSRYRFFISTIINLITFNHRLLLVYCPNFPIE